MDKTHENTWSVESPGVLRLDGTPFTVMWDEGAESNCARWLVRRNGNEFEFFYRLKRSKRCAEKYAAELREVGLLD